MKKIILTLSIIVGAFLYGQAPTNGLIAYYGFESNINSHDSQNNFTAASNTTSTISYSGGVRGFGVYFEGQTGLVNNTLSSVVSPSTNGYSSTPFSLSFWAKESTTNQGAYASLFELYGSYLLRFQSGILHAELNSNAGYLTKNFGNVNPNTSSWRHYVIRYNPTVSEAFRLYINGVDYGNIPVTSATALLKSANYFILGNGMANNISYFHPLKGYQGTIDELFIYNRALTATEITNLYNGVNYSIITNTSHTDVTGYGAKISYSYIPLDGVTSDCKLYLGTSSNNLTLHSTGTSGNSGTISGTIDLTGLQANTTYYYKITSTNSNGTTESEVKSFTTLAVTRPTVTWDLSSTPAFNITSTSADIRFDVNPNNGLTTSVIKYGLSTGTLTNIASSPTPIQGGNQVVNQIISLTNLQPNTVYYYIAESTNSAGTGQASINVGGTNYPAVYSFTTSNLGTNDLKNKLNISISPNPAKDFINIQSDGKIKSVEIYNLHGQKLITTTQKQINISSLSSGIYLVRVEDDKNNTTTKKIIKK